MSVVSVSTTFGFTDELDIECTFNRSNGEGVLWGALAVSVGTASVQFVGEPHQVRQMVERLERAVAYAETVSAVGPETDSDRQVDAAWDRHREQDKAYSDGYDDGRFDEAMDHQQSWERGPF